jgi:hypothetical protein
VTAVTAERSALDTDVPDQMFERVYGRPHQVAETDKREHREREQGAMLATIPTPELRSRSLNQK